MNSQVRESVKKILGRRRRSLQTNLQKVFYSLLKADGKWVPRDLLRMPSASSRVRELRMSKFGRLPVECALGSGFSRRRSSRVTKCPTFYRLDPGAVTHKALKKVFGDILR